jgi:type II secretory pathway component HofQ
MPRMNLLKTLVLVFLLGFATPGAASPDEKKDYDFNDIPVRSALQLLAEEGQFNLVVSDSVTGTITLHLEDVTVEQALAVVLRMKGLGMRVEGNTRAVGKREG